MVAVCSAGNVAVFFSYLPDNSCFPDKVKMNLGVSIAFAASVAVSLKGSY